MTGFLNCGVQNPLSGISVGSLQDMSYAVNSGAAGASVVPPLAGRRQIIEPRYRVR